MKRKVAVGVLVVLVLCAVGYSVAKIQRKVPANIKVVTDEESTQQVKTDISWLYDEVQETEPSEPEQVYESQPVEDEQTQEVPDTEESIETPDEEQTDDGTTPSDGNTDLTEPTEDLPDTVEQDDSISAEDYATFQSYFWDSVSGICNGTLFESTDTDRITLRDCCYTPDFISSYSSFINNAGVLTAIHEDYSGKAQIFMDFELNEEDRTFTCTYDGVTETWGVVLKDGKIDKVVKM